MWIHRLLAYGGKLWPALTFAGADERGSEMPAALQRWGSEMPMVLQWGLLVFLLGALVASMSIASMTLFLYWEHNRPRNYLGYSIAVSGDVPCGVFVARWRPDARQLVDRKRPTSLWS